MFALRLQNTVCILRFCQPLSNKKQQQRNNKEEFICIIQINLNLWNKSRKYCFVICAVVTPSRGLFVIFVLNSSIMRGTMNPSLIAAHMEQVKVSMCRLKSRADRVAVIKWKTWGKVWKGSKWAHKSTVCLLVSPTFIRLYLYHLWSRYNQLHFHWSLSSNQSNKKVHFEL